MITTISTSKVAVMKIQVRRLMEETPLKRLRNRGFVIKLTLYLRLD